MWPGCIVGGEEEASEIDANVEVEARDQWMEGGDPDMQKKKRMMQIQLM